MAPSDNVELIRRLHDELLGSRDLATVEDFFAEGFVSHNMPPGLPAGIEGVKGFFGTLRDGLPDVEVTIDELIADSDKVAVATTMSGTHDGELMGFAPTGRRVSVTGIDLVRIDGGKIVEHRGLTDIVGLMRQLGES
jgi:predicted ester cyclase